MWDATGRLSHHLPQSVGRLLLAALTTDPQGAQALGTARDHATVLGQDLALALRFPPEATAIAALPWELLWDAGPTPVLLSRGRMAALTRHLDLAEALPPPRAAGLPLRILVVTPHSGIGEVQRRLEQTARTEAFRGLTERGEALVRQVGPPVSRRDLVDMVQRHGPFDIVYYYGHGISRDGVGYLVLDGAAGSDEIDTAALAALLGGSRMVVLAACQGAWIGLEPIDVRGSLAPALCAAGIPLVLGMQFSVRGDTAARTAGIMLSGLAAGRSAQDALALVRQAIFVEEADRASWYLPALYVRTRDIGPVYLLPPAETAPAAPPITRPRTSQTIVARGKSKVTEVTMRGSDGATQEALAEDRSSIERVRMDATLGGVQSVRAENESEISDAELKDE